MLSALPLEPVESATVVAVVRVLRVGDVCAREGVHGDHDGEVRHGGGSVSVRGAGVVLGVGVLRAVHLVLHVVALVADGHAAAGVRGDVGPGAEHGPRGRELGGLLQAGSVQGVLRGLVDAGERVPADGSVDLPVAELGPVNLAVGVEGL